MELNAWSKEQTWRHEWYSMLGAIWEWLVGNINIFIVVPVVRCFEEDKVSKTCWGEKCADRSSPGCHSDTFPDFPNFWCR